MSDEYFKTVNRPEARHRYWHLPVAARDFFPEAGEMFKLKFHDKEYELNVNHKDDIMTGKIFADYKFLEGDPLEFTKKKDHYVLKAEKTKPW